MKKFFNTVGPIDPAIHYFLPRRLDWDKLDDFLEKRYYFLLHAPRQSGKTTAIREFVQHINQSNKYNALYITTEPAHVAKNNIERTVYWLLTQFARQIRLQLPQEKSIHAYLLEFLKQSPIPEDAFAQFLEYWSERSDKPLVIFFDEIDGLVEISLLFVLKQLRSGYPNRPAHFPQSVCLIGVRNLQDYKLLSIDEEEKGILLSPFNIVADMLVLRNFTKEQVKELLLQHTKETGQAFTDEALEYAHCVTQGQPWLVNALAYQSCFRDVTDRSQPITKEVMERAKEQLILRQDTHINALVDRLNEPRVRNIIDAIISGTEPAYLNPDDLQYVRDLGLLKEDSWEIANPIYQQVIPRALTAMIQGMIQQKTAWYVDESGALNMTKLLEAFTQFFRENAEAYDSKLDYKEAFPHLMLMAFLQRIVNGKGKVYREYALGSRRVDIFVQWKDTCFILELKIEYDANTEKKGLEQITHYADIGAPHESHLLIFNRNPETPWEKKISNYVEIYNDQTVHIWKL